ncbi:putative Antihemorrhagic factor cHLP-B protein [Naja naja]|nr:putative Antihemorrhagic factor cHLP-B protein [Naja naja]
MNFLVALGLLGQIIGCTFSTSLSEEFDCNGEEAEKLAKLAVKYINDHNLHGYKQTLNVIKEVDFLAPRPREIVEMVAEMTLNLLETKCHVMDPTPVENCTVRQQHEHAVEAECVVRIHRELGDKVSGANCHSKPGSVGNVRRNCMKCPILILLNDPHVLQSVEYVLRKHNEQLPNHVYKVLEISRGQHQYDPEAFYVEFAIVETNCSAQEAHDGHHVCHPKAAGEGHTGFCRATVFRSHAALEKPKDEHHLIDHHYGKNIASPGHNNTVLDLVHSHNHKSSSHESLSVEAMVDPEPVVKREAPADIAHDPENDAPLCPGKVHHFKL